MKISICQWICRNHWYTCVIINWFVSTGAQTRWDPQGLDAAICGSLWLQIIFIRYISRKKQHKCGSQPGARYEVGYSRMKTILHCLVMTGYTWLRFTEIFTEFISTNPVYINLENTLRSHSLISGHCADRILKYIGCHIDMHWKAHAQFLDYLGQFKKYFCLHWNLNR